MYRATLSMLTLVTAALHIVGTAQAQPAVFDVADDCDGDQFEKIALAVDGAMHRLTEVDNVINTSPEQFNSAFANAFGTYETGTQEQQWAGITFVLYHANLRPLLTNTPGFTISSGPQPSWPRVAFRCARFDRGDIVAEKNNGAIILYPVFFDDSRVPATGRYLDVQGSRVGTVLHESVHLLGGPKDIQEGGRSESVQAEQLALNRDPRALSNAENYEMFYMSFPFER